MENLENTRELSIDDFESLAVGSWILGTGGGGDPYLKLLNMRLLYQKGYKAYLTDPMSLKDNDLIGVLSMQGAPLVGQERLADPYFALKPVEMLEEYLGQQFQAIMPLEIGGGNGIHPFMASAVRSIPVVDADTMGRAYPIAQMTSFAVANLKMYPLASADIRDNEIIFTRAASWEWIERLSRRACVEMGSIAATCKAPRTGEEVKKHGVLYSVSRAIELGQHVRQALVKHEDPVQAVVEIGHGKLLFVGKVIDVDRVPTGGFLRGQVQVEGLEQYRGDLMEIHFQNEFSVAFIDQLPVVMTPDLICVLDSVSGSGIGTDTLRYGQRISVVALPAPAPFLTPKGLEHTGPRAFGFDLDYESVFKE